MRSRFVAITEVEVIALALLILELIVLMERSR